MTPIQRKAEAAQATAVRFKDVPLRLGRNDCARMAAYHLRRLGHQVRLPHSGAYASARSGKKALAALGFDTLAEALDSFGFERIAPAATMAGDIVELPSEGPLGAVTIALGNGRVIGWHQDASGAAVLQPIEWKAAWRVQPA